MMPEEKGEPEQKTVTAPKEEQPQQTLKEGKFAGKSAEEVAAAYEELEKKLGTQGQELGQLKSTNEQMVAYLQQLAQQTQAQKPPEPSEQPTAWDWEKPIPAVEKIADKTVEKKLAEFYRVIRTQQAQTASQYAKLEAQRAYPHLFDADTSKEVDSFMQNALRSGTVDPSLVEQPQMWASMAYVMKGFKQNFNPQGTVSPVSPQYGETPAGAKGRMVEEESGEPLDLAPEHMKAIRQVAEATGTKEDDLLKEFKQEQRKKGRR